MDAEILQGFVEQAETSLPKIRGSILVCAQEGNTFGKLNSAIVQIGSIRDVASTIDLEEVEKFAAQIEEKLKRLADAKEKFTDAQAHQILDDIARLETLIAKINFSLDDFSTDIDGFVDEYFENIQAPQPETDAETVEETAEEEFEIDEEMLEVFALEAEELTQNISANLKILESSPNNREALLEVRRSAHTLKGSAGIIGLKKLSQVAHRVEDLLDYLADNQVEADSRIFELLLTATDCFEALAIGETSPQLTAKITRIYKNCDEIFASLKKKDEQTTAVSRNDPNLKTKNVLSAETPTANASVQNSAIQNGPIVRVSLEKLDDLFRCVSGLVVSRSVFEQRLEEFERQAKELQNTTRRLQVSAGKLEVDFEANTLGVQSQPEIQNSKFELQNSFIEIKNPQAEIRSSSSFDALEFDRYTEFHQITRELIETAADNSAINSDLATLRNNFEMLFDSQRRLIEEMQDKLLHLRMVTFGLLSLRLQRTVRVTCEEEDKQAELFIEGENLEIDTQILDALVEPLLHLLRNAVAHGIELPETRRLLGKPETGKISLRVFVDGTHLVLTVTDDGRGISAAVLKEKAVENKIISKQDADVMSEDEAFALIFLPGLTTAEHLSQVSGRGVGMNIVKTGILRRQGTISIHSEAQKGTTFTIRLPLPLAITNALPVKSDGQIFAFPLKLIKEAIEVSSGEIKDFIQIGDTNYTVVHLNNLLGLPSKSLADSVSMPVLLVETAENFYALVVDEILKPEEIVIKKLGMPLQNFGQLLGAATLGNGNVIPILDLHFLLKQKVQTPDSKAENQRENQTANSKVQNVMVVDDSPSVRHLTSKVIKNANMNVVVAKDGLEALEILQNSQVLPDVILTDVEMPRMDGYELLASLKKQEVLSKIPVIMITSRAGEKHRLRAFDIGASEYLTKPFEESKLIGVIKRLTAL